jgi:hypothetical protein
MTGKKIVLIVGSVVVVLVFVVLLFVGGIVGLALYQLGNSDAAAKSKDFLRNNEKLKADIGDVKDFGSLVTGGISLTSGGGGEANLYLKVIGERQTVNAEVHLVLVSGSNWRVSSASYVNSSGLKIDLLDPFDTQLIVPQLIA